MSYFSRIDYVSTGSGALALPFPYLSELDIYALDNGVAYTGSLTFDPAGVYVTPSPYPAAGHTLTLYRQTQRAAPGAIFSAGPLNAADLNRMAMQCLFVDQELTDALGTSSSGAYQAGAGLVLTGNTFTPDFGQTAGKVVQGNDSRIAGALQASNNLTDVPSPSTARTSIGAAASGANGDITSLTALTAASLNGSPILGAALLAVSTDGTFASPDDGHLPTTQAVKTYFGSAVSGLHYLAAVGVASTANLTLSGEQTIDGVTTSASRILVKDQTTATQNGIYVTGSGSWSRASDASTGAVLLSCAVFVAAGTLNDNSQFANNNSSAITVGSTAITFAHIGNATTYTAGTGLTLTGQAFSVNYGTTGSSAAAGNDSRIVAAAGIKTATNTWGGVGLTGTQGQQTWELNWPTTNYPIIACHPSDGIVGPRSQTMLQIVGQPNLANGTSEVNMLTMQAYGGYAEINLERYDRYNGTVGPNNGAVLSGEQVGVVAFCPYDGSSDGVTAGMGSICVEDQTNTPGNHGTDLYFFTTPKATHAPPSRVTGLSLSPGGNGGLVVGYSGGTAAYDIGPGYLAVERDIQCAGTLYGVGGVMPYTDRGGNCGSPTVRMLVGAFDNMDIERNSNAPALKIKDTLSTFSADLCQIDVTRSASSTFNFMRFAANNSLQFYVKGDGSAFANSWNAISDRRVKDNIEPLDPTDSGAFFDKVRLYTWTMKDTGRQGMGAIAQDVIKIDPRLGTPSTGRFGKESFRPATVDQSAELAMCMAEIKNLRARLKAAGL